jgi:hypothetical protein
MKISKQQNSELKWDGRAKWWPASYKSGSPGGDSNLWMCAQDAGLNVRSIFEGPYKPGYDEHGAVWLDNCSPELSRLLVDSIPFKHHHNQYERSISETVVDFVQMVAQELVLVGSMTFEISAGWDLADSSKLLRGARLTHIHRRSLMRMLGIAIQLIPLTEPTRFRSHRVVKIDNARLVRFLPPNPWRRSLKLMRSSMPLIGQSEHNWMMNLRKQKVHEDFAMVARSYSVQRAKTTSPIGWVARGMFREHISDYHLVSRELCWNKFCIALLYEILSTLSQAFCVIGSFVNERPTLRWNTMPDLTDIKNAEGQLAAGEIDFDEALRLFTSI